MGIINKTFFIKDDNDKTPFEEARLTSIEFYNRTNQVKRLWIEPTCVELELDANSEFKLISRDDSYKIEFDVDYIVVYLMYTFDLRVYKRPISKENNNPNEWVLIEDYS